MHSTGFMWRFGFVRKMERFDFCCYFFHDDSFQNIDLFDFCLLFVPKEKFSREILAVFNYAIFEKETLQKRFEAFKACIQPICDFLKSAEISDTIFF